MFRAAVDGLQTKPPVNHRRIMQTRLKSAFSRLTRRHVLSKPHGRQQTLPSYAVRMSIAFSRGDVVVSREDAGDVYVLLRDVFAASPHALEIPVLVVR